MPYSFKGQDLGSGMEMNNQLQVSVWENMVLVIHMWGKLQKQQFFYLKILTMWYSTNI